MISVGSEVQILPGPPKMSSCIGCRKSQHSSFVNADARHCLHGDVAQMEERLPCRRSLVRFRSSPPSARGFAPGPHQRPTAFGNQVLGSRGRLAPCGSGRSPVLPSWGRSSAGRAPALQAGGHRFDPDRLHQDVVCTAEKKTVRRARSSCRRCVCPA